MSNVLKKEGFISIEEDNFLFNGKKINVSDDTKISVDGKSAKTNDLKLILGISKKLKALFILQKKGTKVSIEEIIISNFEKISNDKLGVNVPLQFMNKDCIKYDDKKTMSGLKMVRESSLDFILKHVPIFKRNAEIMSTLYGGYDLRNKDDLRGISINYSKLNKNNIQSLEKNKKLSEVNFPPKNKI